MRAEKSGGSRASMSTSERVARPDRHLAPSSGKEHLLAECHLMKDHQAPSWATSGAPLLSLLQSGFAKIARSRHAALRSSRRAAAQHTTTADGHKPVSVPQSVFALGVCINDRAHRLRREKTQCGTLGRRGIESAPRLTQRQGAGSMPGIGTGPSASSSARRF